MHWHVIASLADEKIVVDHRYVIFSELYIYLRLAVMIE